jgi:hypothetical protein
LLLAIGFTTPRAQSMKSFTTGVSVRFLSVITPTGHGSNRQVHRQDLELRNIGAESQERPWQGAGQSSKKRCCASRAATASLIR